jgi:hypothetical protein
MHSDPMPGSGISPRLPLNVLGIARAVAPLVVVAALAGQAHGGRLSVRL